MDAAPLLSVEGLCVEFRGGRGVARVLNGVDLSVRAGETLGLVGESGSGKSMTALALLRLVPDPPGRISAGRVLFEGEDLVAVNSTRIRDIRGNKISMIFQEPMTSLNPVFTVGAQICETLRRHLGLKGRPAQDRAIGLLQDVGIPAPEQRFREYPHQLSGGMRQRVMIAMAIACEPALLIADEPTTALDVTVQAQIFDLLREIQQRRGMAMLLITHDMGVIAENADRMAVMYGGRVVEEGLTRDVLDRPLHPYTRGLIACIPDLHEPADARAPLPEIPGLVPSVWELQRGCPFADRCSEATDRCRAEMPPPLLQSGRRVACWQRAGGSL